MAEHPRIEELRRRVQRDKASIAFAQLAEEYRRAGRFEEAIETCRTGLAHHPGYLSAHVTLGRALIEVGELQQAQDELKRVLDAAPENLAALKGLADIHYRRGEQHEALAHYRRALEFAPHDPDLEHLVSQIARDLEPAGPPAAVPGGLSFEEAMGEFLAFQEPAPSIPPAAEPGGRSRRVSRGPGSGHLRGRPGPGGRSNLRRPWSNPSSRRHRRSKRRQRLRSPSLRRRTAPCSPASRRHRRVPRCRWRRWNGGSTPSSPTGRPLRSNPARHRPSTRGPAGDSPPNFVIDRRFGRITGSGSAEQHAGNHTRGAPMINVDELKRILELARDHDLSELELESEGFKMRLRKGGQVVVQQAPPAAAYAPAPHRRRPPAAPAAAAAAPAARGGRGHGTGGRQVADRRHLLPRARAERARRSSSRATASGRGRRCASSRR